MMEQAARETQVPSAPLNRASIEAAHEIIKPLITRTPLLSHTGLSQSTLGDGQTLYFKAENLQRGGAFKLRGASYSLSQLSDAEKAAGVCTHSSGNHAAGVAMAARTLSPPISAHIVMPTNSPTTKIENVRSNKGTELVFCEPTAAARAAAVLEVQKKTGAVFVPPFDSCNTILGQGTVFLEIEEQAGEPLAAIIAPVGGGGLLAGIALAAAGTGVRVFGAEPMGAADTHESFRSGKRTIEGFQPRTIADGVRTPVGVKNFEVIKDRVDDIIVVSDEEILEATRLIFTQLKVVAEPTGALAFAAARSAVFREKGIKGNIAVIISGGNVDLDKGFPWEWDLTERLGPK